MTVKISCWDKSEEFLVILEMGQGRSDTLLNTQLFLSSDNSSDSETGVTFDYQTGIFGRKPQHIEMIMFLIGTDKE